MGMNNPEIFREIFNNSNDAIMLHKFVEDGALGRFIEVNQKACDLLGYSREEFIEMTPIEIVCDDEVEKIQRLTLEFLFDDRKIFQTFFITKDGNEVPVELSCHLFSLKSGTVVVSIARDIKERQQADEKLRLNEEKYRSIVDLSPDAVFVHEEGYLYYANQAAAKLMGVDSPEDVIGMNMDDYLEVCPEYNEVNIQRKNALAINDKKMPPWICKLQRKDGLIIETEIMSVPVIIDGKPAVQIVARDITERLKIEELRKKAEKEMELYKEIVEYDRLKTEFFANVSHEIRTPLNLILGGLQLMQMNMNPEIAQKLSRYTGIMRQNCYRLLRLVNNLIDITKIDSGYLKADLKNENIVSIVEEIVMSIVDYVKGKSLEIQFDTDIEEKIMACDADKIERIMMNLLSNAIKFTQPGDKISVAIKDLDDKIRICVKDTGIGISEDKQDIIFERFRQADKLLTRSNEGSGIGLSIVKSMVEMHGGNVSLKSEYGKGTEFIIELPVVLVDETILGCNEEGANDFVNPPNISKRSNGIERASIEFSDIYS